MIGNKTVLWFFQTTVINIAYDNQGYNPQSDTGRHTAVWMAGTRGERVSEHEMSERVCDKRRLQLMGMCASNG